MRKRGRAENKPSPPSFISYLIIYSITNSLLSITQWKSKNIKYDWCFFQKMLFPTYLALPCWESSSKSKFHPDSSSYLPSGAFKEANGF